MIVGLVFLEYPLFFKSFSAVSQLTRPYDNSPCGAGQEKRRLIHQSLGSNMTREWVPPLQLSRAV